VEPTRNPIPHFVIKVKGNNFKLTYCRVFGVELRRGDRVRLWPESSADIMDIALHGRIATIEVIEQDYESRIHLAQLTHLAPISSITTSPIFRNSSRLLGFRK
jgi:hypothetical protein